jgi:hypothetical protein
MSKRIPKTMSSVETTGLLPLAPTELGDRIKPKMTPCNNRTAVMPPTRKIALAKPCLGLLSSRIIIMICSGTTALPMMNGVNLMIVDPTDSTVLDNPFGYDLG